MTFIKVHVIQVSGIETEILINSDSIFAVRISVEKFGTDIQFKSVENSISICVKESPAEILALIDALPPKDVLMKDVLENLKSTLENILKPVLPPQLYTGGPGQETVPLDTAK